MGYDYLPDDQPESDVNSNTLSTESFTISHDGGKRVTYTNPLLDTIKSIYTDTGKLQEQDKPDGSTEAGEGGGVASK
jgi:hypothetical protein